MSKSIILRIQSGYYLLTGVWPLIHIRSFLYITGYKTDLWLVRTTGVLITAIAVSLWMDTLKRENTLSIPLLALLSAGGLMAIDVIYVSTGVISAVYLADAAVQSIFVLFWIYWLFRNSLV